MSVLSLHKASQPSTTLVRPRMPKSRPIQWALLHHSWFGVLRGSEVSGQNTGCGSRTRTTGVGSPSREIRRVFAGGHSGRATRMHPGQDPDDYLYHMDSCRDRLNACNPPEGPTDWQYEDNILQPLPSEYDHIRQTHLSDFSLAYIRCMMAAIYADNLSRSEPSKGIAGRGAAMQAVDRDRISIPCHYCDQFGHLKKKVPTPNQTSAAVAAAASSASSATTTWSTSAKAARTAAKQR